MSCINLVWCDLALVIGMTQASSMWLYFFFQAEDGIRDYKVTGVQTCALPISRVFTKDDLNLLTVMANIAAVRIEHARLAEIENQERMMAHELGQAAEIQRRFLPAQAPRVPGLDLSGHNAPCRTVGGDYFDFFPYPSGRVAMVLGDVSGKGMPASLLMMQFQARVQLLIEEPE